MNQRALFHSVRRVTRLAALVVGLLLLLAAAPAGAGRPAPSPKPPLYSTERAAARSPRCTVAWDILPIAVNEYWRGSEGRCPYDHCGEPYSFVRDPAQPPPFSSTDGGGTWFRNVCPDPYNADTCQGPYDGAGENFGKAFALLGADAEPNYGSPQPRSGVELDYRYDALEDGGTWNCLVDDDTWLYDVPPVSDGVGKAAMQRVIRAGGYGRVPLPRAVLEPPPEHMGQWAYCWDTPPENCFNYPAGGRTEPYDALQFLSGTASSMLALTMKDNGYVGGRYAPGQRIVVAVYNGYADYWGQGSKKNDAAVLVGYFRAVIVGYGNHFDHPCEGTPGDWQSYTHCIYGNPSTVYGLAETPLVLDPTPLFPPPNQAPEVPYHPVPADGAAGVPLTQTLSWESQDPDGDPLTYTVAFGPYGQPPVRAITDTTTFDPGPLASGTTYLWQVTASDCLTKTAGPVWRFRTAGLDAYVIYLPLMCRLDGCP